MIAKNKIISYRTCLLCNKQFEKSQLVRLVKINGKLIIDINKNMLGRGYWIHLNEQVLNNQKNFQILSKRTRCNVNQDLIDSLKKLLSDKQN